MAEHIETKRLEDQLEVDLRLAELGLTREGLLRAVRISRAERANATALHPANAPGTFSYHHGVGAIRREYIGEEWIIDRTYGIEAIYNKKLMTKVSFCNVDYACGRDHPKPRSDKGGGAERASGPMLFDDLKTFVSYSDGGIALYYLMVDQIGRAELTRPVIAKRTFTGAIERIFLLPDGEDTTSTLPLDSDDVVDDFDPQIVRK